MTSYVVYLDEFGHIGPYLSYQDKKHNTHPAFGLGGFALPFEQIRDFSTFDRYSQVLVEAIKRLNQEFEDRNSFFSIVLDKQEGDKDFRSHIVSRASIAMYGSKPFRKMIEPPIEAESHLFQTLQCADWLCGLLGRMAHYQFDPKSRPDFSWSHEHLGKRLRAVSVRSSFRPKDDLPAAPETLPS